MSKPRIIAAAALNQTPLDWEGNVKRILIAIEEARNQQVSILILPELSLTGYGCEDYFLMPWVLEKAMEIFRVEVLPKTHNLFVAIGLPLMYGEKRYNTLALCQNGVLVGFYAKQILARTGVHYEPRWFDSWPRNVENEIEVLDFKVPIGDITVNYNGLCIGFEICEDAWHPDERPGLKGAARDADLILNASASHHARGKIAERRELITGLKGKNDAYYLYTNLLGNESGRVIFDGEILFGNDGMLLSASSRFGMKDVVIQTFELDESGHSESVDLAEEDDFEDFTAACSLGLLDYLRKSGSKGFALSLSGGADSATCAVLVAEMIKRAFNQLGKKGLEEKIGFKLEGNSPKEWTSQLLFCVFQGTKNSGETTRNAAKNVADELGAKFISWEIDELVQGYTKLVENTLNETLSWKKDDLVLQNIQARTRAPGIWMLANTRNFLLLSTGNRSEGDVGYCTMDGDTAGSLAPIAGVSKQFILEWLVWAKETLGYQSLQFIIDQRPTAELRPAEAKQTDEADLMPYDLLEAIEQNLIGMKNSEEETLHNLLRIRTESSEYLTTQIRKFIQMWKRSQWKRERLAPSFHLDWISIDPKSGGRFPILSK